MLPVCGGVFTSSRLWGFRGKFGVGENSFPSQLPRANGFVSPERAKVGARRVGWRRSDGKRVASCLRGSASRLAVQGTFVGTVLFESRRARGSPRVPQGRESTWASSRVSGGRWGRRLWPCPHRAGCRVQGWTSVSPRGARLTHASRGLHPAPHPARVFHDARSSRRWK